MIRQPFAVARHAAVAAIAVLAAALASCSGSVDPAPTPVVPGPITVLPATATLYANQPTTFVVSGGNGSYIATSSDQNALPSPGAFNGNSLTVVPGDVTADTPVTLTIRDTSTNAPANAALTVRPRTVSNTVTITPSASQPAACGTAVCSGGDAEVRTTLLLNGVPLQNRTVRFDVVSGEVRIITSPAGTAETLGLSGTAVTDSTGTARIRIRALNDAGAQTALLQITDVSSGAFQRAAVSIAPSSNAPLNAQPGTINFQGVAANTCASGISADVIVFGGRPPYQISQPGSFTVSPTLVTASGGRFTVTATGQCSAGSAIAVVDQAGASVSVNAINRLSDVPPTTPQTSPFVVSPATVSIDSCSASANVTLTGGTGSYFGASGSGALAVSVNGNVGTITRRRDAAGSSPASVAFSDGRTSVTVSVTLTGNATGTCPPGTP